MHLGDGVDGVPALREDLRVGIIKEADEAWQQGPSVGTVVQAGAGKVGIEDGDSSLSESGVSAPCGLQQVLYDDPLTHFILHWEDHCLTAAQLLNKR